MWSLCICIAHLFSLIASSRLRVPERRCHFAFANSIIFIFMCVHNLIFLSNDRMCINWERKCDLMYVVICVYAARGTHTHTPIRSAQWNEKMARHPTFSISDACTRYLQQTNTNERRQCESTEAAIPFRRLSFIVSSRQTVSRVSHVCAWWFGFSFSCAFVEEICYSV